MARNIELKVTVAPAELDAIRTKLAVYADGEIVVLAQTDRYYRVPHGRLKMRWSGNTAELIRYARPDTTGARLSTYHRRFFDPDAARFLDGLLTDLCGELVTVRKQRAVGTIGATRVHLDQVDDLGAFVELETVLDDVPDADRRGAADYENVVKLLGLAQFESIPGSYSDLLIAKGMCL